MNKVKKKIESKTSIFTLMSKLASENNAINMSQGYPDFNTNSELIDLVSKHMRLGHNQYSLTHGVDILRKKISQKNNFLYKVNLDYNNQITITSGATEGIFSAILSVISYGDEVIIIDPSFDCYDPVVRLSGGYPVHIPMIFPDYKIDWDRIKDKISEKTKMIILNSPHNPSGNILLNDDIKALREILIDNDILILSDEVYEHIIFDGFCHESILKYPDLAERAFVISSFGKTYHTTGWKIGYCIAPEYLTKKLRNIHQFVTFSSNTPIQYAYADILENDLLYLDLGAFYEKKRNLFLNLISKSRFKPLKCYGTYFQMLDYSEISTKSDIDFARLLTTKYGVASIPPSVFYISKEDNNVLRFCFAKKEVTLEKAAEILCKI